MKISLKHFLLGAFIASFPVFFYIKLNLSSSIKTEPGVLAYKSKFSSSRATKKSLKEHGKEIIPIPTLDPSPQQMVMSLVEVPSSSEEAPTPHPTTKPPKEEVLVVTPTQPKPITQTATYKPNLQSIPEDVYSLIDKYSNHYKVNKNMMVIIARCESGFRENAVNGPYAGIYQFLSSTWVSNRNAMEVDPNPQLRFNAEEAVKTAAFKMARDGFGAWPVCQQKAKDALSVNIK